MSEQRRAEKGRRWAQLAIVVQFLALLRTLGEVFRLEYVRGAGLRLSEIQPFLITGLLTAVLCFAAVVLYFLRWYRGAAATGAATVVVLLVYKFAFMS